LILTTLQDLWCCILACKLCGGEKKLVKAHIIPKSMYRQMYINSESPEMYSNKKGIHPRKSHVGEYDQGIVCEACEALFSPWDDYAQELLLAEYQDGDFFVDANGNKRAYTFNTFNYVKLKLFFLSLLWRADASSRPFFRRVDIGPFRNGLRQMILQKNPGSAEDFGVVLTRYSDEIGQSILMDPHKQRFEHVNYIQMYFAGYIAYIKVDRRNVGQQFAPFLMMPGMPLHVMLRPFAYSKESVLAGRILRQNGVD